MQNRDFRFTEQHNFVSAVSRGDFDDDDNEDWDNSLDEHENFEFMKIFYGEDTFEDDGTSYVDGTSYEDEHSYDDENSHEDENSYDDENSHEDENSYDDENSHEDENSYDDENSHEDETFKMMILEEIDMMLRCIEMDKSRIQQLEHNEGGRKDGAQAVMKIPEVDSTVVGPRQTVCLNCTLLGFSFLVILQWLIIIILMIYCFRSAYCLI